MFILNWYAYILLWYSLPVHLIISHHRTSAATPLLRNLVAPVLLFLSESRSQASHDFTKKTCATPVQIATLVRFQWSHRQRVATATVSASDACWCSPRHMALARRRPTYPFSSPIPTTPYDDAAGSQASTRNNPLYQPVN